MQAIYFGMVGAALVLAGCVAGPPAAEQTDSGPAVIGAALSCSSDADCRVVADYCSECACVALRAQQKQDECLGEELQCLVNPCAEHVAMCIDGHCSAESGALR